MEKDSLLDKFNAVGAIILDSHVVYTSGRHGSAYINKDAVYPHVELVAVACKRIAIRYADFKIDCVVGPAMGGIILSHEVSYNLISLQKKKVLAVFAEQEGDGFGFHRGYDKFISGKRILVVEDVVNTGGSVSKVVEAIRLLGGEVVGVGALCDRGGMTGEKLGGVPEYFSLISIDLESWSEENCPLCKQGAPINTEVGKGRQFLTRKARGIESR